MGGEEIKVSIELYSKLRRSLGPGSVAAELYSEQVLSEEQYQKQPRLWRKQKPHPKICTGV